jgi:hypothetical protein
MMKKYRLLAALVAVLAATAAWSLTAAPVATASSAPVRIPFDKHYDAALGYYVGTACDGGTIAVRVLDAHSAGQVQHLTAQFDVTIGMRSFTAILDGDFNSVTRRTLLNGTITSGWLQGAQVHEEGQLVNADTGHFVGELRLLPESAG